ncbi:ABC transporter permease [candidate division KSB1 bacterium]|nr:ABC transporter permease [candidate division KSB1 bacterium]
MMQQTIKNSSIWKVMQREFQRIAGDKSQLVLLMCTPILLFLLLASIYSQCVVTEIPIAICDLNNSEISRKLIRSLSSTRTLKIKAYANSNSEIQDQIKAGIVKAGVFIPSNLEQNLKRNQSAQVVLYMDATNILISNSILKEASSIIQTFATAKLIRSFQATGMSREQAIRKALPIKLETYSIGNLGYNYVNYIIPGLLMMILQLAIVLSSVLIINGEFKDGTFIELVEIANHRIGSILVGKSIPYLLLHIISVLGIFGIIFPIFNIPINSRIISFIIFSVVFVFAAFFVGMAISGLVRNQLLASEIIVFLSAPSFIFCGYTYPLWAMPKLHIAFAQILPFTHFITGLMKGYQLDQPMEMIMPEFAKLLIFISAGIAISVVALILAVQKIGAGQIDTIEEASL